MQISPDFHFLMQYYELTSLSLFPLACACEIFVYYEEINVNTCFVIVDGAR